MQALCRINFNTWRLIFEAHIGKIGQFLIDSSGFTAVFIFLNSTIFVGN